MSLLLKDAEAVLDYSVDWGAEYLGSDALARSTWAVTPSEIGGAEIIGSNFDHAVASVQIGGGVPGKLYRISNHIVTALGREDGRSIMLRVEAR